MLRQMMVAGLVLGLAGISYGAANDDFESYGLTDQWGGSPPEWTVDSATNECQWIQNLVVSGGHGSKALMMHNISGNEGRVMWNQTLEATDNLLRMYAKRDNINANFGIHLRSGVGGGGDYVTAMYYADDGFLKVHDGAGYVDYATYDTEWHWLEVECDFVANKYRAKLGDNARTPWYDFFGSVAFEAVGSIRFYTFSGIDRKLYVDYIEIGPGQGWEPSTCQEVIASGFGLDRDLNGDCYINLADVGIFAGDWLRCVEPVDPNCERPWE